MLLKILKNSILEKVLFLFYALLVSRGGDAIVTLLAFRPTKAVWHTLLFD